MSHRERYLVTALLLALAIAYAAPIFSPLRAVLSDEPLKDFDWLKVAAFDRFARESLLSGGVARWCPYFGGGYPLMAHPEYAALSPLTLPSYLLGEIVGLKVQLVLALFLGALGTYLLARGPLRLGPGGAALAAVALLGAGWMAWRVHYGWPMHFGYYLFPLAMVFLWRAFTRPIWLVAAAAVMVVILQEIAQGLPLLFLFLLIWTAGLDLSRVRREPRPGRRSALVIALAALTALLGAVKVAGLLGLMARNTRAVPYGEYIPAEHFYAGLREWGFYLVREADVFYKNVGVGWWIALLAVAGVALAWRRVWMLLPPLAFMTWFGLGPNAPLDLFRLLHRFPVFASMHWPMKYANFFVAFTLCLLAGAALDAVLARVRGAARYAVLALAFAPLLPLLWSHMNLLDRSFVRELPPATPAAAFRQVAAWDNAPRGGARPLAANMYLLLRHNEGTIDWDGDILLPERAVPAERIQPDGSRVAVADYRGEAYVDGEGRVDEFRVGVDRFDAAGVATAPGWLVLNQNYDPAWRGDPAPTARAGLLAVPVEAGAFRVTLTYRPRWFTAGWVVSLLTWLGVLIWWRHDRRATDSRPMGSPRGGAR